jgi:hypothetical protein
MLFRKSPDSNENKSISFADVFTHELDVIGRAREKRQVPQRQRPLELDIVGLSFSGGGIRSATFNLGVIQALAKNNLLTWIDYLSTVSGGGYIGSWLSSWAYYVSQSSATLHDNHIAEIERALNATARKIGEPAEAPQIQFLRRYSNYLTPRLGILSGDTLAFVATYTRNLLLNQIVLIAALLSLLLVPRAVGLLFNKFASPFPNLTTTYLCIVVSAVLLLVVFALVLFNAEFNAAGKAADSKAESNADPTSDNPKPNQKLTSSRAVVLGIAVPLFLFCLTIAYLLWKLVFEGSVPDPLPVNLQLLIVALTIVGYVGLWTAATLLTSPAPSHQSPDSQVSTYLRWAPALWSAPAGLAAGILILLGIDVMQWAVSTHPDDGGWKWLVVFGVPLAVILVLFAGVIHLGLIGRAYEDGLREWWARLGGVVMAIATYWFLLSLATLAVPAWLESLKDFILYGDHGWITRIWRILSALGITSLIAAWIGGTFKGLMAAKSPQTGPQLQAAGAPPSKTAEFAARLGPPIFAAGLVVLLSVFLYFAVPINTTPAYVVISLALGLYALSRFFGYRLDVNEFSLHNAYRNRIVRCYLGATHERRKPQPFTGFDDSDNIYLDSLVDLAAPFHILNATLNAVKGQELALQARKARSFVFTPLYSGFDYSGDASTEASGQGKGSYRLTKNCSWKSRYPGARLGTAMAISGAAASPNMGHYTNGAVSFLLTIFSVRLGWWLGNPRIKKAWESGQPRSSWRAIMNELTGNTNEDQREVYLSDGGHFENLGMYELVRRRCRVIIASDAGADPDRVCNDLAAAIEKCRVDFGAQITINIDAIRPAVSSLPGDQGLRLSKAPFVIGKIRYPDDREGTLIYLKPSLNADLPQDVLAYARLAQTFPHQSTIDQFFDEAQFESYRALGFACASAAIDAITNAVRA